MHLYSLILYITEIYYSYKSHNNDYSKFSTINYSNFAFITLHSWVGWLAKGTEKDFTLTPYPTPMPSGNRIIAVLWWNISGTGTPVLGRLTLSNNNTNMIAHLCAALSDFNSSSVIDVGVLTAKPI